MLAEPFARPKAPPGRARQGRAGREAPLPGMTTGVLIGLAALIVSLGSPGRAVSRVPAPPPPLAQSVAETDVIVLVEVESDEAQSLREGESRSWFDASQLAMTCRILRVLKAPAAPGHPKKVTVLRAFRGCIPHEYRLRKKDGRIEEYCGGPQEGWSSRKGVAGRKMLLFLDSLTAGREPLTLRYTELDMLVSRLSVDDAVARVEAILAAPSGPH